MAYCQSLARKGAQLIADTFGTEVLDNDKGEFTKCCMANARLPISVSGHPQTKSGEGVITVQQEHAMTALNYLTAQMVEQHHTFIAVMVYKGNFWVRISGQIYLEVKDLEFGVEVLKNLVNEVGEKFK